MLKNNAEALRKHRESLSSDTKGRIQESDTAAHQKRRQSLSPNTKAHIQESNTTAHQKRRQNLSPDTKARIQETNTTAHRKCRQSLSPDEKARIQEINQKQRHKYMNQEEKKIEAQIKEYAANLPSAIDIDQLTVEFLREIFYKHPTLALVYYHCCSVDPRASIWNDESETSSDNSGTWDRISDLIGDPIGQKEALLCQQTFETLDRSHAKMAACASCCECLLSSDGPTAIVK